MVYAKMHYILLSSYPVVTEYGACNGGSMTAMDPVLFKALTGQYAEGSDMEGGRAGTGTVQKWAGGRLVDI